MAGPTTAEVGRIAIALSRQGATITQNKTGWKVKFPNGDMMVLHRTYGDYRSLNNIRATVKRHGLTWPGDDAKTVKAAEKAARAAESTGSEVSATMSEYKYPQYMRNGSASPKIQERVKDAIATLEADGKPITQGAISAVGGINPSDVNRALFVMGWRYEGPVGRGPRIWVRSEATVTPIDRHVAEPEPEPVPDEPTPLEAEPVPAEPEPEAQPPVPDGDERPEQRTIEEAIDSGEVETITLHEALDDEPMPPSEYPLPPEAQMQPGDEQEEADPGYLEDELVRETYDSGFEAGKAAALAELQPEAPRERIVLDDHDSWVIEPLDTDSWASLVRTATRMGLQIECRVWRPRS